MKFFLPLILSIAQSSLFGLPSKEVVLEGEVLTVEIADKEVTRRQGLMFRTQLAEGHGMLFIHPKPQILSFWMKNTYIPLSIGFFDEECRLINIENMPPCQEGIFLKNFTSSSPAVYALEVPQGWFAKKNIRPGAKFSFRDP